MLKDVEVSPNYKTINDLSDDEIMLIRKLYSDPEITMRNLSEKFNCYNYTIKSAIEKSTIMLRKTDEHKGSIDHDFDIPFSFKRLIINDFNRGLSIQKITIMYNVSRETVLEIIDKTMVELDENGDKIFKSRQARPTKTQMSIMRRMRKKGATFKTIASELNMSKDRVYYYLNRESKLTDTNRKIYRVKPEITQNNIENIKAYEQYLLDKNIR